MLNRAQRRQLAGQSKAQPVSVPAPIGGWNTRDALDAMTPTDATVLDNWYPTTGKVTLRKGYSSHATGVGAGNVDFVAQYHAGSRHKLLAASATNVYDASSSGAATSLKSGFTNGQWQHVNFNGYLIMVNGDDTPQQYDGSSLTDSTITATDVTVSSLNGIAVFKNRLYLWKTGGQDFWYLGVNAITGTLTKFPLSRVGQFGGNLVAVATWTLDGGNGIDDYAVFVMSSGEVIVYSGTDPGDANAWSLVGVYHIAEPLGARGIVKEGGDLRIMTTRDYVSLKDVLINGQLGTASKVSGAVVSAAESVAPLTFGWQALMYRRGGMAIFNVPNTDGTFDQHVQNLVTKAWCRFTDIPARCWGVFAEDLYFGSTDGTVYKADTGNTDGSDAIQGDGRQAWNSFGSAIRKRLTAVRPVVSSQGGISYEIGVGFDFRDANVSAASSTPQAGAVWDVALWDITPWSADSVTEINWRVASGSGQNLSPGLRVAGKQEISWLRTDFRIEVGINL